MIVKLKVNMEKNINLIQFKKKLIDFFLISMYKE